MLVATVNGSCFMEPTLEMSPISTLKDLTESSVGNMVSGLTVALKGQGGGGITKLTVMMERDLEFIWERSQLYAIPGSQVKERK